MSTSRYDPSLALHRAALTSQATRSAPTARRASPPVKRSAAMGRWLVIRTGERMCAGQVTADDGRTLTVRTEPLGDVVRVPRNGKATCFPTSRACWAAITRMHEAERSVREVVKDARKQTPTVDPQRLAGRYVIAPVGGQPTPCRITSVTHDTAHIRSEPSGRPGGVPLADLEGTKSYRTEREALQAILGRRIEALAKKRVRKEA